MLAVFLAALDQVSLSNLYNWKIITEILSSSIDYRCYGFADYRCKTWRRGKLQLGRKVTTRWHTQCSHIVI